jgi:hypothetical protein
LIVETSGRAAEDETIKDCTASKKTPPQRLMGRIIAMIAFLENECSIFAKLKPCSSIQLQFALFVRTFVDFLHFKVASRCAVVPLDIIDH